MDRGIFNDVKGSIVAGFKGFDWIDAVIGLCVFGVVAAVGRHAHLAVTVLVVALFSIVIGWISSDDD